MMMSAMPFGFFFFVLQLLLPSSALLRCPGCSEEPPRSGASDGPEQQYDPLSNINSSFGQSSGTGDLLNSTTTNTDSTKSDSDTVTAPNTTVEKSKDDDQIENPTKKNAKKSGKGSANFKKTKPTTGKAGKKASKSTNKNSKKPVDKLLGGNSTSDTVTTNKDNNVTDTTERKESDVLDTPAKDSAGGDVSPSIDHNTTPLNQSLLNATGLGSEDVGASEEFLEPTTITKSTLTSGDHSENPEEDLILPRKENITNSTPLNSSETENLISSGLINPVELEDQIDTPDSGPHHLRPESLEKESPEPDPETPVTPHSPPIEPEATKPPLVEDGESVTPVDPRKLVVPEEDDALQRVHSQTKEKEKTWYNKPLKYGCDNNYVCGGFVVAIFLGTAVGLAIIVATKSDDEPIVNVTAYSAGPLRAYFLDPEVFPWVEEEHIQMMARKKWQPEDDESARFVDLLKYYGKMPGTRVTESWTFELARRLEGVSGVDDTESETAAKEFIRGILADPETQSVLSQNQLRDEVDEEVARRVAEHSIPVSNLASDADLQQVLSGILVDGKHAVFSTRLDQIQEDQISMVAFTELVREVAEQDPEVLVTEENMNTIESAARILYTADARDEGIIPPDTYIEFFLTRLFDIDDARQAQTTHYEALLHVAEFPLGGNFEDMLPHTSSQWRDDPGVGEDEGDEPAGGQGGDLAGEEDDAVAVDMNPISNVPWITGGGLIRPLRYAQYAGGPGPPGAAEAEPAFTAEAVPAGQAGDDDAIGEAAAEQTPDIDPKAPPPLLDPTKVYRFLPKDGPTGVYELYEVTLDADGQPVLIDGIEQRTPVPTAEGFQWDFGPDSGHLALFRREGWGESSSMARYLEYQRRYYYESVTTGTDHIPAGLHEDIAWLATRAEPNRDTGQPAASGNPNVSPVQFAHDLEPSFGQGSETQGHLAWRFFNTVGEVNLQKEQLLQVLMVYQEIEDGEELQKLLDVLDIDDTVDDAVAAIDQKLEEMRALNDETLATIEAAADAADEAADRAAEILVQAAGTIAQTGNVVDAVSDLVDDVRQERDALEELVNEIIANEQVQNAVNTAEAIDAAGLQVDENGTITSEDDGVQALLQDVSDGLNALKNLNNSVNTLNQALNQMNQIPTGGGGPFPMPGPTMPPVPPLPLPPSFP